MRPSRRPAAVLAVLALAVALAGCGAAGSDRAAAPRVKPGPFAGAPVREGTLTLPARVQGGRIALARHGRFAKRFWAGVDLGATIPGHAPGEVAATRADYDRWLRGMAALGAHVVRVYTILRPRFYDALAAYDRAHPGDPLYFIQGVWIPEAQFLATGNAYDPAVTDGFDKEIGDAVDVVHGHANLPLIPGHAGGRYRSDVSRWLLAWSPGIEWDPVASRSTDVKNAGHPPFEGRYVRTSTDATPMESWIAARLDHLATLEAARGWSRPITFTNWTTTDPLRHPQEPLPTEDMVGIDAMHLHATHAWPGGFFASYHAYPYYPDFLGLQPNLARAHSPYAAYLRLLRRHHGGQAVMITEFGVPTGLGAAHRGPLGRDQGDHSEQQAAAMDAQMMREIKRAGYAGADLFEWTDEWFKLTWNTQDLAQPVARRPLWRNVLTNEEQFGVVAVEPGKRPLVTVDGRTKDWAHATTLLRGPITVQAQHDAAYLYLLVHRPNASAPVQIGLDTRPGGDGGLPGRPGVDPQADMALTLGPGRSAHLQQAEWTDPIEILYGLNHGYVPYRAADLRQNSNAWVDPRLILDRPYTVRGTGQARPTELIDLGHLRWGTADPNAPGDDERVLAAGDGRTVELRLPWMLLGYADPSSNRVYVVHDSGAVTTQKVGPIGVAVAPAGRPAVAARSYGWAGWNSVQWHERRKAGWGTLQRAFATASR